MRPAAALQTLAGCGRLHATTGRPVALLLDEVDAVPRQVSYVLHGLMLTGTVTWQGEMYGGVPITILAASNRLAKIPPAMRSRFSEVIHVDYYDVESLVAIATREAARKRITLAAGALGRRGQRFQEVTGAIEPFLLRSQLSQITRGGRRLTERGRAVS